MSGPEALCCLGIYLQSRQPAHVTRFRIDSISPRGVFNQRFHGSKRLLCPVDDFTEFGQCIAYFDGDHVTAVKKGCICLIALARLHPGT